MRALPLMNVFSIDWLGRSGPHELMVQLSSHEVRERLKISLVPRSLLDTLTRGSGPPTRFTGEIGPDGFTIRPFKFWDRICPTLTGEIEETKAATRVRFQIHIDPKILYLPLIAYSGIVIMAVVFMAVYERLFPFCLLPAILPAAIAANSMSARRESHQLLQFFVDLFKEERVN